MKKKEEDISIKNINTVYQGFNKINRYKFCHKLFNNDWSKIIERDIHVTQKSVSLLPFDRKTSKFY